MFGIHVLHKGVVPMQTLVVCTAIVECHVYGVYALACCIHTPFLAGSIHRHQLYSYSFCDASDAYRLIGAVTCPRSYMGYNYKEF